MSANAVSVVSGAASLGGGVVLLAYSIYKMDPVFILGQGLGLVVYMRNLYLIFVVHDPATEENPTPKT